MCGLFAACGPDIDPRLVARLADLAGRRGPHGWGFVTFDEAGDADSEYRRGSVIPASVERSVAALRPVCILGHARLATTRGDLDDTSGYQPIVGRHAAVAHNGTVRNYDALLDRHGLTPATRTDSEVITLLADAAADAGRPDPLWWAWGQVSEASPHALIGYCDGRLLAVRQASDDKPRLPGHPLYHYREGPTLYLASVRPDAAWQEVADDSVITWKAPCPSTS